MWDVRWEDGYKGMTFGRLLGDSYIPQSVFTFSKNGCTIPDGVCFFSKTQQASMHGACSRVSSSFTQCPLPNPFPRIY